VAVLAFVLFGSCLMRQLHADVPAAAPIIVCEPAIEIDGHRIADASHGSRWPTPVVRNSPPQTAGTPFGPNRHALVQAAWRAPTSRHWTCPST
jgi:hypothetical protein